MSRCQTEIIHIPHAVMPVKLIIAGNEVSIVTGKSGSQSQMLLDDIAAILTVALKSGVKVNTLQGALGDVDPRIAPVTRHILDAISNLEETRHVASA